MAFETKEEILQKILEMTKPNCPHCNTEMSLWEVPEINFSDGLGWGTPYMFVCFNDDCPSYNQGWDNLKENMEHYASYRCINSPGSSNFEYMPVFSPSGGKGQIIGNDEIAMRESFKEAMKQGFSLLTDFFVAGDWDEIMKVLLSPEYPPRVRLKAAQMVGDIGGSDAVEHLVNYKFPSKPLQEAVDSAVQKLHERHYTRECPYCAEIIKKRASVCRHCQRELTSC
ncbi:MAG: zinc ribbon domain-containing protein [Desulfamplus sp.]|nr:zinc ribbon domain-containing protein [Desulfamplus sp.]MBF0241061.1 zinc ribbon domain-containing protein [Desulfamplus sp.]MBF0388781.1 zinc ribbon domain-containing protein [Desulfamplus sp.]